MSKTNFLFALLALLVGLLCGWLGGMAEANHRYGKLMVDGLHVDAANKITLSLNLIHQAKIQDCQKVVSSLEQLANLSVSALSDYGLRPVGASREIVVPSLKKLQEYQIATHEPVNEQLAKVLRRVEM